ncbi:hypothetical protein P153DRAFT_366374 [Dothidotthia symphoricarpi CBS 119687]|uniref:Uncharacterized protein n=1 Tax=Dothidotthia symphoricarpi CBS 119687 TaxID=1392245 RepID=A0A6A6ADL7_9PLEO|nr:uncharacterized protein P153DRAFT_366374 [Dothidotthia symphoricarpi CBS 119687]KAF2129870.1 hypothetical protein P153DRAFT_366374 [Dothidotthia symphoricarpi CBS 119687]
MVDDGVFPHQTRRDAFDGSAQEVNNTLLVTGSLVWDPRLPGLGFDSMAKQLFNLFASAAWKNDGFHSFGPVRSLFWVEHDDFKPLIAQSIVALQKANRVLELTHNLNVVVAAEHRERPVGRGSLGREPQHELESVVRALRSGRDQGMELPAHRRENIHDFAAHVDEASNGTGISSVAFLHNYLREQDMAGKSAVGMLQEGILNCYRYERDLVEKNPDLAFNSDWILNNKNKSGQVHVNHPAKNEISVFSRMRSQFAKIVRTKQEIEKIADIGEELYLTECKVLSIEDGPEKDNLLKKTTELEEAWKHAMSTTDTHNRQLPPTELDDRIALRHPPSPRLQWDKRPYEPLIMRTNEAWPQNRLGLISAEPFPRTADQNPEWHEWVQDFIFGLCSHSTDSVVEALDKMQHGMSDIVSKCPSLMDPKKGGRLNLKNLRVRLLTGEMITELLAAYRDWPFKAPGTDHDKYFRYKSGSFDFSTDNWP